MSDLAFHQTQRRIMEITGMEDWSMLYACSEDRFRRFEDFIHSALWDDPRKLIEIYRNLYHPSPLWIITTRDGVNGDIQKTEFGIIRRCNSFEIVTAFQ